MTKKKNSKAKRIRGVVRETRRAKSQPLPGMEDHAIKPLEQLAEQYAEIRDSRIDLNEREHVLKLATLKLMKRYEKTVYRHNGIEITIIPGEEDVKVRVKKMRDDDDEDADDRIVLDAEPLDDRESIEQTEERRRAVEDE
jgi:hypothetical protein